jgi:hypothetical protein
MICKPGKYNYGLGGYLSKKELRGRVGTSLRLDTGFGEFEERKKATLRKEVASSAKDR